MARVGRPPLPKTQRLVVEATKLPQWVRRRLKTLARRRKTTRSALLREAAERFVEQEDDA